MSLSTDTSSFSLKPVVPADFPAMADMCGLAFENDRHTMLKAAHPTKPYNHAAGMTGAFEYWLSRPAGSLELTKAVDDATGEILGFVCWGMSLDKDDTNKEQSNPGDAPPAEESRKAVDASVENPDVTTPEDTVPPQDPTLDPLEQLEEMTSSHLAEFQRRFKNTRCMYVITLTVHPRHQGRGVGPALIKQGINRADTEGALCWVHSSEAGVYTYKKCGFKEDDTLEVDLDDWARKLDIKPPAGDDKWGTYTFQYLIRQPIAT